MAARNCAVKEQELEELLAERDEVLAKREEELAAALARVAELEALQARTRTVDEQDKTGCA